MIGKYFRLFCEKGSNFLRYLFILFSLVLAFHSLWKKTDRLWKSIRKISSKDKFKDLYVKFIWKQLLFNRGQVETLHITEKSIHTKSIRSQVFMQMQMSDYVAVKNTPRLEHLWLYVPMMYSFIVHINIFWWSYI